MDTQRRIRRACVATLVALAVAVPVGGPARAGAPAERQALAAVAPQPGTFTGHGFDACTAPSQAAMDAWLTSPYRAVGVYFGGISRACAQPNLTPEWVSTQVGKGWHLMPLYVGLQAPCSTATKPHRIDPAIAASQARAEADDAAAKAQALGLPEGSVLIFDMEAYRTDDPACREAVLTFMSTWTARLHRHRYMSGIYSSMGSGIADQVAVYNAGNRVHPDYVDFARWDNVATVSDPTIPPSYWMPKRRMKQYRGDHLETWGGVTINIDNDYLDVAEAPATPFGDVEGDGWSDLLARQKTTGRLNVYTGNGSFFVGPASSSTAWGGRSAIARLGDFDRDGREDLVSREAATGFLWLHPGNGAGGFGAPVKIGQGWNSMREITPVGDLDRDGFNDLVAVKTATGILHTYRGRPGGISGSATLGGGWNTMDELTGVGDFNRDGFVDLVARHKASGNLYLYPGRGLGFASRIQIGTGWNSLRSLACVGDLDRDGFADLLGIQASTNVLVRYSGNGARFGNKVQLNGGWSTFDILL